MLAHESHKLTNVEEKLHIIKSNCRLLNECCTWKWESNHRTRKTKKKDI
jgi:hypothetical protein